MPEGRPKYLGRSVAVVADVADRGIRGHDAVAGIEGVAAMQADRPGGSGLDLPASV